MVPPLWSNLQRLHRDLIELEREPMDGIQHHLYNDDMTHMCLILSPLSGPFRNLRLYLDVEIPSSYPHDPPKVTIQTRVTHPNVCRGFICCDILDHVTVDSLYNGGYTPAYLLKYVFLQLLSFFSTYEVEQEHGGQAFVLTSKLGEAYEGKERFRERMANVVMDYVCNNCGFNLSIPSVVVEGPRDLERSEGGDGHVDHADATYGIDKLTDDCWMVILDLLSDQDMYALARASPHVMDVIRKHNLLIRRQLVCFFSRKTYTEFVLGIGLEVDCVVPSGVVMTTIRVLDLLSYEAFHEHGVRTGVFGEKFNVFLPVALDDGHFLRAESTIQEVLQSVHCVLVPTEKFVIGALCMVEVLPRLLNEMVLELAKDCDIMKGTIEKALKGYCLLLHLFSKLSKRYPAIEIELRRRVAAFQQSDAGRHKDAIPNIGEFLTYLVVLNEDWQSCFVPFVEELLARDVVWFLDGENSTNAKYPHLAYLEDDLYVSQQCLQETFDASLQSLRLVMIQVSFLRLAQSEAKDLDSHFGYPSEQMGDVLFHQVQRIYDVEDWDVCIEILGFPPLGIDWQTHICKMLKNVVVQSECAGYHVVPFTHPQLFYLRMCAEPSCPPPSWWYPRDEFMSDEFEYNIENGLARLAYQLPPVSFFPTSKM